MTINSMDFRVKEDEKVKLEKWPTLGEPYYQSEQPYQEIFSEHNQRLGILKNLFHPANRWSLLIIFQAMNPSGKDGAIKHKISSFRPDKTARNSLMVAKRG